MQPQSTWSDKLRGALHAALASGTSPEKLALGVALGVTCGLFPVFGTTTLLTFLVGIAFRANAVLVQVFNYLMYPVYFPVAAAFIVAGAWLFGADGSVDYSMAGMRAVFAQGWQAVFRELGVTLLHAVLVWLMVAPLLVLVVRKAMLPLARRLAAGLPKESQSA